MNKLIKEVEFGVYQFKVAINRDIAYKVANEFPDFIADVLENSNDVRDIRTALKSGQFEKVLDMADYIMEGSAKVVEFALPLMLKEADSNENAQEIIEYAIENEADQEFNSGLWEFILLGFTMNGVKKKTPKVSFKMK